jgi:hypothetical protein
VPRALLVMAVILAGCATQPAHRVMPGATLASPPGEVMVLNSALLGKVEYEAPAGTVVAVCLGDCVYGEWFVQPDGVRAPIPVEQLGRVLRMARPGRRIEIAIHQVPVTCEWETANGSIHSCGRLERVVDRAYAGGPGGM